MAIAPRLDKSTFSKCINVSNKNKAECKLGIYEDETLNVLSVDASTYLTSTEISDGEIRYSGKAVFCAVCYNGTEIKKYEAGVEYSYKFPYTLAGNDCKLNFCSVDAVDVTVNALNGILTAKTNIVFNGEVCCLLQTSQISVNNGDFLTKKRQSEYNEEIARVEKQFKVQDEFEMPNLIGDILCHNERVFLTGCQSGIGCVIYDGEIELTAVICKRDEKEPIVKKRRIPFRLESELLDAMPSNICVGYATVNGACLNVTVDESKSKSVVVVEIDLNLEGIIYDNLVFNYAVDAYSCECNLKNTMQNYKLEKIIGNNCALQKINSELAFTSQNSRLICVVSDKIENIEYCKNNNALNVKGALSISMLLSSDGAINCKTALVPFEASTEITGTCVKNVRCTVTDLEVIESGEKFIANFTLRLYYTDMVCQEVAVLTAVEEGSKKEQNDSAISVYIASKGDTLWDISKALNVSEQVVMETNGELEFPLTGQERIVIYREKGKSI